ncbi:MAG: 16S rRNA (uracil(1498)-N(3))-methyltransferase [Oscillospiraceae bacterium]|nr:16S rRNA (uracil(1498)-N(3))-methyltransferase [Oscillospiraceae bacterium]
MDCHGSPQGTMTRFFITDAQIRANQVFLKAEDAHHMAKVLRMQAGDEILCPNGQGQLYRVVLQTLEAAQAVGEIVAVTEEHSEPHLQITLAQCLPKGERWDFILQKCTELGVSSFQPLISERTVVQIKSAEQEKKQERWQKIVQEAAEQSQRGKCPAVLEAIPYERFLQQLASYDSVLLAWEKETANNLLPVLQTMARPQRMALIVGPEGGLTAQEAAAAVGAGAISVSFGPRILRTETAAMAFCTMVLYHYHEMESF